MIQITIDRSKWRVGGDDYNDYYQHATCLKDLRGNRCCLGFATEQLLSEEFSRAIDLVYEPSGFIEGLYKNSTKEELTAFFEKFPEYRKFVSVSINDEDEDLDTEVYFDITEFVDQAIHLNDEGTLQLEKREYDLIELFKTQEFELIFVNDYPDEVYEIEKKLTATTKS